MSDNESTWETEEAERWLLNDEALYLAAQRCLNAEQIEALIRNTLGGTIFSPAELERIDFDEVFQTFYGD